MAPRSTSMKRRRPPPQSQPSSSSSTDANKMNRNCLRSGNNRSKDAPTIKNKNETPVTRNASGGDLAEQEYKCAGNLNGTTGTGTNETTLNDDNKNKSSSDLLEDDAPAVVPLDLLLRMESALQLYGHRIGRGSNSNSKCPVKISLEDFLKIAQSVSLSDGSPAAFKISEAEESLEQEETLLLNLVCLAPDLYRLDSCSKNANNENTTRQRSDKVPALPAATSCKEGVFVELLQTNGKSESRMEVLRRNHSRATRSTMMCADSTARRNKMVQLLQKHKLHQSQTAASKPKVAKQIRRHEMSIVKEQKDDLMDLDSTTSTSTPMRPMASGVTVEHYITPNMTLEERVRARAQYKSQTKSKKRSAASPNQQLSQQSQSKRQRSCNDVIGKQDGTTTTKQHHEPVVHRNSQDDTTQAMSVAQSEEENNGNDDDDDEEEMARTLVHANLLSLCDALWLYLRSKHVHSARSAAPRRIHTQSQNLSILSSVNASTDQTKNKTLSSTTKSNGNKGAALFMSATLKELQNNLTGAINKNNYSSGKGAKKQVGRCLVALINMCPDWIQVKKRRNGAESVPAARTTTTFSLDDALVIPNNVEYYRNVIRAKLGAGVSQSNTHVHGGHVKQPLFASTKNSSMKHITAITSDIFTTSNPPPQSHANQFANNKKTLTTNINTTPSKTRKSKLSLTKTKLAKQMRQGTPITPGITRPPPQCRQENTSKQVTFGNPTATQLSNHFTTETQAQQKLRINQNLEVGNDVLHPNDDANSAPRGLKRLMSQLNSGERI